MINNLYSSPKNNPLLNITGLYFAEPKCVKSLLYNNQNMLLWTFGGMEAMSII